ECQIHTAGFRRSAGIRHQNYSAPIRTDKQEIDIIGCEMTEIIYSHGRLRDRAGQTADADLRWVRIRDRTSFHADRTGESLDQDSPAAGNAADVVARIVDDEQLPHSIRRASI